MSIVIAVLIRVIVLYTIMHVIISIVGIRGLTKLTIRDYIVGIVMGSIAGRGITKIDQPIIAFITALTALGLIHIIFSYLSLKNEFFQKLENGQPLILIQKGQIVTGNLKKAKISMDELYSLLRQKDIFKFSDVEYALMEPSGSFSVLPKSEQSNLKAGQFNIATTKATLPILVIKEGKIIAKELKQAGLTEKWLRENLQKLNIQDISGILLAQADTNGLLYICFYDDRPAIIPSQN